MAGTTQTKMFNSVMENCTDMQEKRVTEMGFLNPDSVFLIVNKLQLKAQ